MFTFTRADEDVLDILRRDGKLEEKEGVYTAEMPQEGLVALCSGEIINPRIQFVQWSYTCGVTFCLITTSKGTRLAMETTGDGHVWRYEGKTQNIVRATIIDHHNRYRAAWVWNNAKASDTSDRKN